MRIYSTAYSTMRINKLAVLLALLIIFTPTVTIHGQIYLSESFEGTWSGTPAVPSGWSIIHTNATGGGLGTDPVYWRKNTWSGSAWSTNSNYTPNTPAGAQLGSSVAWYNNVNARSTQKDQITTPAVDLSGSNTPGISFYFAASTSAIATLKLRGSSNGGSTWNDIQTIAKPGQAWTKISISFPVEYKVANAKFGFEITASGLFHDFWLDNVVISDQLSGTKTIKLSGGDFSSFTAAITALNSYGVSSSGVTFDIDPGFTSTENCPAITTTGTLAGPIIFKKASAGTNPLITAGTGIGTGDAIITLQGCDYITFDGIDLQENLANVSATTQAEYGYYITNYSAIDGAQNNTIQNCKVTLNRANASTKGIYQFALTPATNATGCNSANKYYNVTIENSNNGISLSGTSNTYPDLNCEIGVSGFGVSTIGGNGANDIGGGTSDVYGVYLSAQSGISVSNLEIRNVASTSSTYSAYGIYLTSGVGTTNYIKGNRIHDITTTALTYSNSNVYGIYTNLATGTNIVNIYNNFIYSLTNDYAGAGIASYGIVGICLNNAGSVSQTYYVVYNSIRIDGSISPNISNACFQILSTTGGVVIAKNNIFSNFTGAQSGNAKHICWVSPTLNSIGITGSSSDYNDLFIYNTVNGFVGIMNTTAYSTLSNWKGAASNLDLNSKSTDPYFASPTSIYSAASQLDGAGIPMASITQVDIDGLARNFSTPDIGANEFTSTTMTFVSLTTTQNNLNHVGFGSTNTEMIGVQIVSSGSSAPLTAGMLTFSTLGSTSASSDIINAKLWYTGTNPVFSASTQVGSTSVSPNGTFTINANQTLASGTNYFWLTYDIASSPSNFNVLDAQIATVNVGGADRIPTITSPSGSRTIFGTLSGTYTINQSGSGNNNYTSFTQAIFDLNNIGFNGATTFNVSAGTYIEDPITLTASGSVTNTITFQKEPGALSNPILQGKNGIGYSDAVITLSGSDYVMFDGIDLKDSPANPTAKTKMENAVLLNGSATNGNQHNTFKNGIFTLDKSNTNSTSCVNTSSAAASASGINSYNAFLNLTVQSSANGYTFNGSSSFPDDNNQIDTISGGGSVITDLSNCGILVSNQTNFTVKYTSIYNISGTAPCGVYSNSGSTNTINVLNTNIYSLNSTTGNVYGINSTAASAFNINNCSIHDLTSTFPSGSVYGINLVSGLAAPVSQNTIYNLSNTAPTGNVNSLNACGIYISSPGINSVYRNKVYSISGTIGVVNGITIMGGSNNYVYNNVLAAFSANGSITNSLTIGIYATSGTNNYLYYNSIYLTGTSTSSSHISYSVYAGSISTLHEMINNVLVNNENVTTGTRAVALRLGTTSLTNLSANNNRNLFYAGAASTKNLLFDDGTNSDQTLVAFKTRMGAKEVNSLTELPPFLTTTDCRISTSIPTQVESGGSAILTPVNITSDNDGVIRNANTPDIGAYEATYILSDLSAPTITYTALVNTSSLSSRTITVTIADVSPIASGVGSPTLYWRITPSGAFTAVTGVPAGVGTYTFSFGEGVSLGNVVQYYICAQDASSNNNVACSPATGAGGFTSNPPAVSTPPTTLNSYTIVTGYNGTYTVGVTGSGNSWSTVYAAIQAINGGELTGPTTLALVDANYSSSETFPIRIDVVPGSSLTNTLTIKPAAGVSSVISGSATSSGIFVLNGADNVILNGSNNGSSTQNLTITNTSTNGAAVWVSSLGAGSGATNNTIKNCILNTGGNTTVSYGICVSSNTTFLTAGDNNDNLTIQNNLITKAFFGIYVKANSAAKTSGLQINGNQIGSLTNSLTIGTTGIYISGATNPIINGNTITNIYSANFANSIGIQFFIETNGALISNNSINGVSNQNTGNWSAYGIDIEGITVSNIVIVNNTISNITTLNSNNQSRGLNAVGILLATPNASKIYYNSVNLYGIQSPVGTFPTSSAAMFVNGATTNVDIRNNIFSNSLKSTLSGYNAYSIYITGSQTTPTIGYNDYFGFGNATTQYLVGYHNGTACTTLTAWQSAVSGGDANSLNVNPLFSGTENLQPATSSAVIGAGVTLAGYSTDITGSTRNASTPSIGAYETVSNLTTPPNNATIVSPSNNANTLSATTSLNWLDGGGGAVGYKLYFGTDNPPTNIVNGTNLGKVDTYNPGTLLYSTTYYWKVVAFNTFGDASGTAIWSFTTDRDRSIIPAFENFDNFTAPTLPLGWLVVDANSDLIKWASTASNPLSGMNAMKITNSAFATQNDWFFTNGYSLISGALYELGFWYRCESASLVEAMEVKWGSGQSAASMNSTAIFSNSNITNITYQYATAQFTATSTGLAYIGFRCFSPGRRSNLYVDDISLKVAPAASNSQTINASSTSATTFIGTGAVIQFTTANTSAVNITVAKVLANPGGSLPMGILNLANQYWPVTINSGTVTGTYSINLDLTGITGINGYNSLKVLKRDNASSPWVDVSTISGVTINYSNPITVNGLTSFSEFGIGGLVDNPLPVELSSFSATAKERDVKIEWNTKTEKIMAKFDVERKLSDSKANSLWSKVGEIAAAGNSNSPKEYMFLDKKLNSGTYQYRLKMINQNGEYDYSKVIESNIDLPKSYAISQNYPNPFNPSTKVDYQIPYDAKVSVELYSITGEKVAELFNLDQTAGYYSIDINATQLKLASGIYIYRIIARDKVNADAFMQLKKMVLLK